jgi:TetR/AcrR family transcriptional repressor for divergent bdcA
MAAVETALLLFWQQGYEGTSLAQLRSAMQISSVSFYAAFESKESLFEQVMARYVAGPGRVTDVVGNVDLPGREAIARLLHGSIERQATPLIRYGAS